ncbi:hypothetical protein [Planococcus lenghuensis]|uniref:hypothetical protein n=1 Tax=Planococcus lenghuensis TaxID=2213202 RepID=UPI0012EBEC4A|nr:hypothetical protein [Planococcus lenghuensis]
MVEIEKIDQKSIGKRAELTKRPLEYRMLVKAGLETAQKRTINENFLYKLN